MVEQIAEKTLDSKPHTSNWMRSISFAGLLRVLHLIAEYPDGVTVNKLNAEIRKRKAYLTPDGSEPTSTTLYYCHNVLWHLEAIRRREKLLTVNSSHPQVMQLLGQPPPAGANLDALSREAFANLVLENEDCKAYFFDLFMPETDVYSLAEFRNQGKFVVWERVRLSEVTKVVVLRAGKNGGRERELTLRSPSEIKSVLYGLRYWARDELKLVDEFFREDTGNILYPISLAGEGDAIEEMIREILSKRVEDKEWTSLSLRNLGMDCCLGHRQPLERFFAAIQRLSQLASDRVVLIPTSRSFATFTASTPSREEFELRGYFRDARGRYISHIRLHQSLSISQIMPKPLERLKLKFNPFEPAASGAPLGDDLWLPESWKERLRSLLDSLENSRGVKAIAISGEYGSGKSYILQWLNRQELPNRRIKPFYFDNPGVHFYDLANSLLRQIGRKDFAKYLWELVSPHITHQLTLFERGYEDYLRSRPTRNEQEEILSELQNGIRKAEITSDEEIAYCLARLIADTPKKPYFEYRDFVAGKKQSALVAEREEAPYFAAILKTMRLGAGIEAVAFLIDEFEEVSLQKRLTRRDAHDYLATLKRLINLATTENFWLIVAMTPQAVEITDELEPAFWERFVADGEYQFELPPLSGPEAVELVKHRLKSARLDGVKVSSDLFPFPEEIENVIAPATLSNPRRLIKVCSYAIGESDSKTSVPFSDEYLQGIENKAYPKLESGR